MLHDIVAYVVHRQFIVVVAQRFDDHVLNAFSGFGVPPSKLPMQNITFSEYSGG
jgi:hypothetical protein